MPLSCKTVVAGLRPATRGQTANGKLRGQTTQKDKPFGSSWLAPCAPMCRCSAYAHISACAMAWVVCCCVCVVATVDVVAGQRTGCV